MSKLGIIQEPATGDSCGGHLTLNLRPSDAQLKAADFKGRAALVTLGCAKNQVDSEIMLGVLRQRGFEIVDDLSLADVAIVNTCGFLQSAIEESLNCILEIADYKKTARLRKLIVAGCLVSRYQGDLKTTLPEVDSFLSSQELASVADVAENGELAAAARPYFFYDEALPRVYSSSGHSVYVKIAEGCNRPCTFCIIPKIRGKMQSRQPASVISEVQQLAAQGVREFNLVAQDLTDYGHDLSPRMELAQLLAELDQVAPESWIRLLYAYPVGATDSLMKAMVSLPRVCKYLDIPLQHSSETVLKAMQRPLGKCSPRKLVERIRAEYPEVMIRTTFIVGFPGETEQDIDDLEDFIKAGHFSSVGIFCYSPEEGTPSADMSGQIPEEVKSARRERLMLTQQDVVADRLRSLVGSKQLVLIDGLHPESDLLITGRTQFQAPEVDGCVIITDSETPEIELKPGMFCQVEITDVAGYDLCARVLRG